MPGERSEKVGTGSCLKLLYLKTFSTFLRIEDTHCRRFESEILFHFA